jgi:hypothetical protein
MSARSSSGPLVRLRDGLEAHLGSRDVARVIYGAVVGLALVVALETHPPSAGEAAALLILAAVAVGLAELYSEVIAREARERRTVEVAGLREMAAEALAVMAGAGFPAVFFLLAAAGAFDVHTAFTLSKWSGVALLGGYAFLGARLAGLGVGRSLAHAAAIGALGGTLIVVKALVH